MPDLSKRYPMPTLREIVDKYHDRETERLRSYFRLPDLMEQVQLDLDREIERRGRQWHDAMLDSIVNNWSGSGDDFERDDRGDKPRRGDAGTVESEDKPIVMNDEPEADPSESEPDPMENYERFGTCRDLSRKDVRAIVRRCRAAKLRGIKISAWYHGQGIEPDAPRSYALETLRKWLVDPKFNLIDQ